MIALLALVLLQATVPERMQEAIRDLQAGETEEARALLESIVADAPRHGPARLQLGQLAVSEARWEDAREHLEIAVRSNPQRLFLAWHLLGRARAALGDGSGAREAYGEAIALAPDFVAPRLALAELAESENDLYTALAQYRTAVDLEPGNESIWAALANAARRAGAVELARCAVARAGESGATAYLHAAIEEEAGNVDEALAWTETALERGLESAAVFVTRGDLLHEKMRLTEAIAAFERAVAIDPVAAESIASFALTSLTTEDYARLRAVLEKHAEAHPDGLNTLYSLGAMYSRDGELRKALSVFERLAVLLPESSQVHYQLAMIYRRLGEAERSEAALERFRTLKRVEDATWQRENERHRLRLRVEEALDEGRTEEAARLAAELDTEGAKPEDLVLEAKALAAVRDREAASKAVEAALAKTPYDREALRLGAEVAEEEEAAEYRKRLALLEGDCAP